MRPLARLATCVVAVLLALAGSTVSAAQRAPAPAQVPLPPASVRIGVLTLSTLEAARGPNWPSFVQRLADHGYMEGHNLVFVSRAADGDAARLPDLAQQLVAERVDVIFALFTPAVLAAKQTTSTIPIVIPIGGDPVGSGLIDSFEHPGGNVTGMSDPSSILMPGLVRVLTEALPGRRRLAVFTPPGNPAVLPGLQAAQALAQPRGVELVRVDVAAPSTDALDAAFTSAVEQGAQGFVFYYTPTTPELDRRAAEDAAQRHLPGIYETRGAVDAGGLMSETVDYNDSFARAADYVAQILAGADPAELPVGVPERFELVINVQAATALGIAIPPEILGQATEVIR
jgi:putative tryptophan/tyrosine transport system substrate-binding protein